ncbi:GPR endopeptidase [Cellulosilyticum sp. ST5]|uniref:GPR endopeptidase n=1 Tax=unclassified Cellulosilyticum TaxID=2643091 RepID=UPI000F8DDC74|nr:GPR endopeptidase [Cellulosilyticum sp. WCF-2]QEH69226.1 GPR endopeptidase [Cellulosilyticum sp. WCF-2]
MDGYEKVGNFSPRTDLAIEISNALKLDRDDSYEIPGVEVKQKALEEGALAVTKVCILNTEGEKNMGKPIGDYITIESNGLKQNNPELHEKIISVLAEAIKSLLPEKKQDPLNILVIGLGNRFATPDTLGPKVANQVFVTRHMALKAPELLDEGVCYLSSFAPSVMGLTGIETAEVIRGVADNVKPDCIIAIDALAARSATRINTTIQITNTGISPGAGVGNKRKELNEATIGCKVIAVGVPTVVDTVTLVSDALNDLISHMLKQAEHSPFYDVLKDLTEEEHYQLIKESIYPEISDLFVTPKEIDEVMEYLSSIVANGINLAVHPGMTLKDINKYTY